MKFYKYLARFQKIDLDYIGSLDFISFSSSLASPFPAKPRGCFIKEPEEVVIS